MITWPFWIFESYIGILKPKQSHGIGLTMGFRRRHSSILIKCASSLAGSHQGLISPAVDKAEIVVRRYLVLFCWAAVLLFLRRVDQIENSQGSAGSPAELETAVPFFSISGSCGPLLHYVHW